MDWGLKKRIGPLAYVWASILALRGPLPEVTVEAAGRRVTGQLACLGNGRFYGGRYPLFPAAQLEDGLLDITVVPRVTWFTVLRLFAALHRDRLAGSRDAVVWQAGHATISAAEGLPFHLEGDNVGPLPVTCSLRPRALRVVVPERG